MTLYHVNCLYMRLFTLTELNQNAVWILTQLAFLSFEEDQKEQALRALHETAEMCKSGSAKSRKASRRKKMKEVLLLHINNK